MRRGCSRTVPFLPGITHRLHWNFPAPSQLGGSEEEKLIEIRKIRDSIRQKIEAWAATIKNSETVLFPIHSIPKSFVLNQQGFAMLSENPVLLLL